MIEFDYRIVRDEGNEKKTYTPTIQKKLPDLVCIEGPNSSGKSTLLNIIALGLYGQKNRNINESLKKKIDDLVGEGHQQLTYSVSITNEQEGLSIVSSKEDPYLQDMSVYEIKDGGRNILTSDTFEKKYNLIYDIPYNPMDRLDGLTKELKEKQRIIGNHLVELDHYLRNTIKEVQSSRDPGRISKFKEESESLAKELEGSKEDKSRMENDLQIFSQYYNARYFLHYKRLHARTQENIKELAEKLKEPEKKEKKFKKKASELTTAVRALLESTSETLIELAESLGRMGIKTKDDFISIWIDLDLVEVLKTSDKHYQIFDGIKAFKEKLKEQDDSLCSDGRIDEASLLEELIDLLGHYYSVDIRLPGVDKPIPEFIQLLQDRLTQCQNVKDQHNNLISLIHKLDTLDKDCHSLITKYIPEIVTMGEQMKVDGEEDSDEIQKEYDKQCSKLQAAEKSKEYFRDEMIRSGVKEGNADYTVAEFERKEDFRMFSSYTEVQFHDKKCDLEEQITETSHRIGGTGEKKSRIDQEISRLEKQKPHKYQDYNSELDQLFGFVQVLEKKLTHEFAGNLNLLTEKALEKEKLENSQKLYFNAVSIYLGRRVGSILHIDEEHIIDRIDLITRKVITEKDKVIYFSDFGTGQSQSAYLTGILKSSDDRKVIALIDEVAMMDSQSLKPVYEILRKKYNEGSLLAAIIIQKGESLKVEPMP